METEEPEVSLSEWICRTIYFESEALLQTGPWEIHKPQNFLRGNPPPK